MPVDDVGPGRTFGSYEVLEELGRGGMGRVFRARHVTLERNVALKLLAEQFAGDDFYVQRFLREARAAARLNHPNIVQIYDFGQVESLWYIAMELVDGRSLTHFLKTWGRFSEQNAIAVARQALAALGVAHAAGIVHRDVKPDNLILGPKGIVKLVDLGLAKRVDDPGASATGFAAGTPYYISPEQIEGRADVDGRADLYSLGATLFQLVTGQVPFPGPSSAVIMSRHLNERAPDPRTIVPGLSPGFSAAVLRLLARERERRPPTAADADRELAAFAGNAPAPAVPGSPPAGPEGGDPSASALDTAYSSALASAFGDTRHVEERLALRVGPLARVLVRKAERDASGFDDLCRRLAGHIPDEAGRQAFLREVLQAQPPSRPSGPGSASQGTTADSPRTRPPAGSAPSGAGSPSGPGAFPPHLLAAAEQRLAAEIGPLARILVKKEARRRETWLDLVEGLAAHVPDEAGRRRLLEALSPLGV